MSNFRVLITPKQPTTQDYILAPDQFFSPTLEGAQAELKKWMEKGHHGRYKITEQVEKVVEEGEC